MTTEVLERWLHGSALKHSWIQLIHLELKIKISYIIRPSKAHLHKNTQTYLRPDRTNTRFLQNCCIKSHPQPWVKHLESLESFCNAISGRIYIYMRICYATHVEKHVRRRPIVYYCCSHICGDISEFLQHPLPNLQGALVILSYLQPCSPDRHCLLFILVSPVKWTESN